MFEIAIYLTVGCLVALGWRIQAKKKLMLAELVALAIVWPVSALVGLFALLASIKI